ncbi:MAG: VOC family protein [Thermoleophilia bacterium]|nr:VOC family protein [Thermoleophilia bacterium]
MSRSAAPWPAGAPCWVDCQVDDPARAAAFYAGLLGWGFGEHDAATDGYLTASLDGAKAAGIGPKASGAGMPSVWHTYFAVDDVDAAAASVAATGGTVLMMPFNVGTSGRMAMAADPRGATFGLWRGTGLPGADVTHRCGAYGWSELRTPDTGRAARFYEWLFGWAFADASPPADDAWLFIPGGTGAPGGVVRFDPAAGAGAGGASWAVGFLVADLGTALGRVDELGGVAPPEGRDGPRGREALVAGACGETFLLVEPGGPPGARP